jgi:tetratricopeptide (TPR) repeat protein
MLDAVLEHAERAGEVLFPPRALNSIAWIYAELQHHELAIDWNRRSVDAAQALGLPDPEIECNAVLNLADSLMALGRLDEADQHFAFVGRIVNEPTPPERWALWRYSQHYFHSFGELHLLRGDAESAIMLAEKCLRLAEETESRKNIVKARRLRGQANMAVGDLAAAEVDIVAALELAIDIGNPGQLWKTHEALGDLRRAQGRVDDASTSFGEALAVLDGMAASLTDDELRSTLLGSTAIGRLRDLVTGS